MRVFPIMWLALAIAGPASAQHAHDPHAGHKMEMQPPATDGEPEPAADPHADHDMSTMDPANETPADPHAGHDRGTMSEPGSDMPETPPPAGALVGPRHAADIYYGSAEMAEEREQLRVEQGGAKFYSNMADRLEARIRDGRDSYLWDLQGWYGGDIDKLWIKAEGEGTFGGTLESAEVQALWSRAITPYFDVQAGLRYDVRPDPERAHFVVGLQGLAPYWFEIDAAAFLSDKGDLTARFEAEYDQEITQRLILQPRVEFDLALQDVPEIGIGSGISSIEAGVRLRYEFVPEFAPYVGIEYERRIGDSADFARAAGEDVGGWSLLVGLRTWF